MRVDGDITIDGGTLDSSVLDISSKLVDLKDANAIGFQLVANALSGALAQTQADWTENDSTKASYIQHKPVISDSITSGGTNLVKSGAIYTSQQEQEQRINPLTDYIFGYGSPLSENDDLNNYTTPCKMSVPGGISVASISNKPLANMPRFILFVIPGINDKACYQFLFPNNNASTWYKRYCRSGTWTPWSAFDGTEIAQA